MKKIVIVGNTIVAASAIDKILSLDSECQITAFFEEGVFPYQKDLFADYLANKISDKDIFYKDEKTFNHPQLKVITDKKISRINFRNKRVTTETKEQFYYDELLIAEPKDVKISNVKGTRRERVFNLSKFVDIKTACEQLALVDVIVMQVNSFKALSAACALKAMDKDVTVVANSEHLISGQIDKQTSDIIVEMLESQGIRVELNSGITDLLGDSVVKAVRLTSGKIFEAQFVVIDSVQFDLKLFKGTPLELDQDKICVDGQFRTNIEHVFAAGEICKCNDENSQSIAGPLPVVVLEKIGEIVGDNMCGSNTVYTLPIPFVSWREHGQSFTLIGSTEGNGFDDLALFDSEKNIYKKAYSKDQCIQGAILVNADQDKEAFVEMVCERKSVDALDEFMPQENVGAQEPQHCLNEANDSNATS